MALASNWEDEENARFLGLKSGEAMVAFKEWGKACWKAFSKSAYLVPESEDYI